VRYSAELLKLSRFNTGPSQGASNFFNELNNSIFSKLDHSKVVYIFHRFEKQPSLQKTSIFPSKFLYRILSRSCQVFFCPKLEFFVKIKKTAKNIYQKL